LDACPFHCFDTRYLVQIGHADKTASNAVIETNGWHALKVVLSDDHFSVWLDNVNLFTAFDRTRMKDGRVALWTMEENVTRFDQISIRTLPDTEWR